MKLRRREEASILILTLLTIGLFLLSACGSTPGGWGNLSRARKPAEALSPLQAMSAEACFSLPYGSDLLSCYPGQSFAIVAGDDPAASVRVSPGSYTMQGVVESTQTDTVPGSEGIAEMMLIEPFSLKISVNGSGMLSTASNSPFSLSQANLHGRNITMTLVDGTKNAFTVSGTLLPLPDNLLLEGTGFSIQAIGKTPDAHTVRMDAVLIPDNPAPPLKTPPSGVVVGKS